MKGARRMIYLLTTVVFVCSATFASAQAWTDKGKDRDSLR